MLRMALSHKGVPIEAHCASGTHSPPPRQEIASETAQDREGQQQQQQQSFGVPAVNGNARTTTQDADIVVHDDGGIDL